VTKIMNLKWLLSCAVGILLLGILSGCNSEPTADTTVPVVPGKSAGGPPKIGGIETKGGPPPGTVFQTGVDADTKRRMQEKGIPVR
jgi:hypothetical protein